MCADRLGDARVGGAGGHSRRGRTWIGRVGAGLRGTTRRSAERCAIWVPCELCSPKVVFPCHLTTHNHPSTGY
eukprot:6604361-Prymnesium_polylepis.1